MVDRREDDLTATTTTTRDPYVAPAGRRGSSLLPWIIGGLAAIGLIFAFSTWDTSPDGTQTTMTEQPATPPVVEPAPAVQPEPAPAPAPAPAEGTGTNP